MNESNALASRYEPKQVEERLYKFWEQEGFFKASVNASKKPYCIVIPPPNVTGILHMGHALNNTIQDILTRYKRMRGFEALWIPGTDHAGIATQNVVERKLQAEGLKRQDLGREKFLERVWEWKNQYGNTIIMQLKRLGSSCDWSRTRFTMDEGLSEAVAEVFVRLYNEDLIYKGYYVINWCPRCMTALSDEEAAHKEQDGKLYFIKYPIKGAKEHVVVATTRPETMLGDVAVAVNPKDERYRDLIGKTLVLPLVEKEIKVIADDYIDKEFGTGACKVTPAHDVNDYQMALRHGLEAVIVMNPDATLNHAAGEYEGLDRYEAREAIIEDLKERKLLLKIEDHKNAIGHCYRCHTVVEPYLSPQWFVKMKPLAKDAIEAAKAGKIRFTPDRWTKVYLDWMENVRDWCISRQIWWGHRLPVYYCKKCYCGQTKKSDTVVNLTKTIFNKKGIIVSKVKPEKCPDCGGVDLVQDEDVLDTWFSSWLWPITTLGWPKDCEDLKYFYPTNTLVTASEILFFWVARMIMSGLKFKKQIPFSDVYIHGTVRDDTGKKMSKSLGNIIDPIEIINEFGADALRFSMISITATGADVYLSKEKFLIGRNFANKVWNASRFILMNISPDLKARAADLDPAKLALADKWIISRLNVAVGSVSSAIDRFNFNEAANLVYEFFWHEFCDWYIELIKPALVESSQLTDDSKKRKQQIQIILINVLENSLKLLHPFMPFITEEIWQKIPHEGKSIMVSDWPVQDEKFINESINKDFSLVMSIVSTIRNIRSDMNIGLAKKPKVLIASSDRNILDALENAREYILTLANIDSIETGSGIKRPQSSASSIVGDCQLYMPLEGLIDINKEKARLSAQLKANEGFISGINSRLANNDFVSKAPEEVIEGQKQKLIELESANLRLNGILEDLK